MNNSGHQTGAGVPSWLDSLRHDVLLLRHGHSHPLKENVVVSDMVHGCDPAYGLTELGRRQVMETVSRAIQEGRLRGDECVVSSPLSRTQETAQIEE